MFGFKKQRRLNWAPRSFMGGDQEYFSLVDDGGAQDAVRWASNQLEIARHAHQEAQEKNEALTEKIGAMEASLGLCAIAGAKDAERINSMTDENGALRDTLARREQDIDQLNFEIVHLKKASPWPRASVEKPVFVRDVWVISGPAAVEISRLYDAAVACGMKKDTVVLWQYIRSLGVLPSPQEDIRALGQQVVFCDGCVEIRYPDFEIAMDRRVRCNYHYLKSEETCKCKK